MSARSLGRTYKVDLLGGPSATYVRTYELTKNLQDQGDSLTIRNAREKSDEIRDSTEGDTMTATAPPIGTRVRPTTNPDRPGTITHHGRGWVTIRHDNGETVDWFTWAIEVIG